MSEVVEAAVIGLPDSIKGQIPLAFVVLKAGLPNDAATREQVARRCGEHVRKTVGPIATLKHALVVAKLPKTRSGKIARNTLAAKASGNSYKVAFRG